MEKIPTLFERDPSTNFRYVRNVVHPKCQWVLDGEGVATRKYDGTCIMFDGNKWWARREVKPGKTAPEGFIPVEKDAGTEKVVGWEPAAQSSFWAILEEVINPLLPASTYELVGPKINGNPENYPSHFLVQHGQQRIAELDLTFEGLNRWLQDHPYEGIVWWHPDGRRAKLKKKDFPA